MHRVNKVLIVFLAVLGLSFFITWTFLQSDVFGKVLSKIINEYSTKAGVEVNVQKVNFSFFPPGGVLKGIRFVHRIDDDSIEAELDELILHLGFWNFWNEKPHFENIEFKRGTINLKGDWVKNESNSKEVDSVKFDLTKDFKRIQDIANLLPVKISGLQMNKIDFKAINNKYQVFFNDLKLIKRRKDYEVYIDAYPEIPVRSFKKPILIDQIKGKISFDEKLMDFQDLELKLNTNRLNINGTISDYLNKNQMSFDLSGNILASLMDLEDFIKLGKEQIFIQGDASVDYTFKGLLKDFNCEAEINVQNVITKFIDFNSGELSASITNKKVIINDLKARYFDGEVILRDRFIFADISKNLWLRNEIPLFATNFSLRDALKGVPVLKVLNGRFSGPINLQAAPDSFKIFSSDYIDFNNFKLAVDSNPIIELDGTRTKSLNIDIQKDTLNLGIDFDSPAIIGELRGEILNGIGEYSMNNTLLDFDKISFIDRKFALNGQGAFNILATTSKDKQILNLKGVVNNTKIYDFNLSNLSTDLSFYFHDNEIRVKNLKASYGQDSIVGNGIVNYKKRTQKFNLKVPKLSFRNFTFLLKNYVRDVEYFPESLITKLSGQLETSGGLEFKKMLVSGRLYSSGGELFNEKYSYGYTDIYLERGIGLMDNMLIKKSESDIKGSFSFNFLTKKFSYNYKVNPLQLQNINLFKTYIPNFEGSMSGTFEGSNIYENNIVFDFDITKARIDEQLFDESKIIFKSLDDRQILRGNLLGQSLEYDIILDSSENRLSNQKKSKLSVKSNITNINDIAKSLSREYFNLSNLNGALVAQSSINFNMNNWSKIKLEGEVEKILFNTDLMTLDYKSNEKQFIIEKSNVRKWDFAAKGRNIELKSIAEGRLGGNFKIINTFQFDLSLFSTLFRKIQRASGKTVLTQTIKETNNEWIHEYQLDSSGFSLATDLLPFNFKQGLASATMKDRKLIIENFKADLSEGRAFLKGELDFKKTTPVVNLRYSLNRAGVDLFSKSKIFLSGNGALLGRRPPYILSGDLTLNRSYIVDEFQDIIEENRTYNTEVKYLPENSLNTDTDIVQVNVDLKADDYISISNSLTDTKVKIQGNLTGNFDKFYFDGFARLYGNRNKVYFKSAEYDLKKLDLLLSSDRELSDPEIDIWATSIISDYSVDLKAYGRKDDLNFSLSSEPNLSQNDIISLIAFGYTNKISNDLSSDSREALTRAGIGSFVFDQIGLNKTLKREFGLQLSLGTQFQAEEDLLNQRTGSNIGRVRSATKIEVKKDITDKVDLSLSTTVGGNIGETRSMNLNYDLRNNVSVQGVYEIITNQQGDENRIDNSAGADLKFRWEFK